MKWACATGLRGMDQTEMVQPPPPVGTDMGDRAKRGHNTMAATGRHTAAPQQGVEFRSCALFIMRSNVSNELVPPCAQKTASPHEVALNCWWKPIPHSPGLLIAASGKFRIAARCERSAALALT
jgi:hypothetical protein